MGGRVRIAKIAISRIGSRRHPHPSKSWLTGSVARWVKPEAAAQPNALCTSWLRQAARSSGSLAATAMPRCQTKGLESGLHLVKPRLVVEPKQAVDLLAVPLQPAR